MKKILNSTLITIVSIIMVAGIVYAGSLSPSTNVVAPTQHTLSDIYNKISNLNYTAGVHSLSTTTSPAPSSVTLDDIYGKLVTASTIATPGNIRDGVTILGVTGTYTGSSVLTWSTVYAGGTWYSAADYCAGTVDGSTGWRLPTPLELNNALINQFQLSVPMGFPITALTYWSTSVDEARANAVYYNGLIIGSSVYQKSYNYPSGFRVRCVR